MPTDLVFLVVTALVGGLLVLGAALAIVRERTGDHLTLDSEAGNGWGKYEPDADAHEGDRSAAATSAGVVRVLWWVTIAAVLVGVGLSDAYRANQALIFGLGAVSVVAVVVLHELLPRAWRSDLLSAAEIAIGLALASGLLLLTGYGSSPYVFTLDLIAVAVALARGGWAAVAVTVIATVVYLGVVSSDPTMTTLDATHLLPVFLNVGALWLLAFLAGVFAAHERRVRRMLSDLSRIDPLTGLFNRGQIYATLEQEVRRTRRSSRGFSLLMVDLDGLKAVNDSLGHQRGDDVLRALGRTIRASIRTVDSAYRYGGDEFLVLLPETDYAGAFVAAEKIRAEAEEMGLRLEGEGVATSVSIGLVSHPEDGGSAEELVRAADRAMYNAKALGKNQISGFPRPPRLTGPVAILRDDGGEAENRPGGGSPAPAAGSPGSAAAPADLAAGAVAAGASSSAGPASVAVPVGEAQPEAPPAAQAPSAEDRQAPSLPTISLGFLEHPEDEEPDAAEVRRQIAVATRSFDPDHQIRRAMDAFLSPPPGTSGRRRPD